MSFGGRNCRRGGGQILQIFDTCSDGLEKPMEEVSERSGEFFATNKPPFDAIIMKDG